MPISGHWFAKWFHKLAQGFGNQRGEEEFGSADVLRALRTKDARIYKRIDGIALIQYPDHIASSLLDGRLWRLQDFKSAMAILQPRLNGGAFIDVGANSGMVAIYAARQSLFKKIIAIEPLQANYELPCANLRLNDVQNAAAVQCAVSDRDGEAPLPVHDLLGGSGFAFKSDEFELVRTRRLDELLEEIGIDAPSVALVWISVRGHENAALDGMTKVLAAQVPLVIYFCRHSAPAATVARLQNHYQHCAWMGEEPQAISSSQPEKFKKGGWLTVW